MCFWNGRLATAIWRVSAGGGPSGAEGFRNRPGLPLTWTDQALGRFSASLRPGERRRTASSRLKARLGRPSAFPWALAVRRPARARSRIISLSSSENAARICSRNRDMGFVSSVSRFWVTARNRTPSETSSWMDRMLSATLRPQRSSFQTRTASKRRARASCRSRSSSGRLALAPLQPVSTYSARTYQPRLAV
jgi:hypothetical protein